MTAIINGVMVTGTPEEINSLLRLQQGERPSNYDIQVCDNKDRPDYPTHLKQEKTNDRNTKYDRNRNRGTD